MKKQLPTKSTFGNSIRGYSLIELLLCILVFAIGAKGAALCAQSLRETYLLRTTLHATLGLCNFAAYSARRSDTTVELAVSADHSELRLTSESSLKLLRSLTLPHNITLREFTAGGTGEDRSIRFYPDGTASPGRISLGTESGSNCVIMQALRGARRWQCHGG